MTIATMSAHPLSSAPAPVFAAPGTATAVLGNGMRVTAVRSGAVARVEMRLAVPLVRRTPREHATAAVLATTVLRGQPGFGRQAVEDALARMGGELAPVLAAEHLLFAGGALTGGLRPLLRLLSGAVRAASHPEKEVLAARTALGAQLGMARRSPAATARRLLVRTCYEGGERAAEPFGDADVAAVSAGQVRALHAARLRPAGATLVLVGDLDPGEALAEAHAAFAHWSGGPAEVPPEPSGGGTTAAGPGEVRLFPVPGAGTAQVRLCAPAAGPADDVALRVANLLFGGYFSARLTTTLRERLGYTYTAGSSLEGEGPDRRLVVAADTAPGTAAAVLEAVGAELAAVAAVPPDPAEVAAARRYGAGALALAWSTQAGLATTLVHALGDGRPAGEVYALPARLGAVPVDAVDAALAAYFAPGGFSGVVLGAPATPAPTSTYWSLT